MNLPPQALDDFVIDPVEVLLPTTLGSTGQLALIVGVVASLLLLVLLGATPSLRSETSVNRPGTRWRWLLAATVVATGAALGLEVALRPGPIDVTDLLARQPAALTARLVLLGALGLLTGDHARSRSAALTIVGLAAITVPLATSGLTGTAAIAGTSVLAVLAIGAVQLTTRWSSPASRRGLALLAAALLLSGTAVTVILPALPEPAPPFHAERVAVSGVVLDVTVAPVAAGRNEFHLYAWDDRDREVDLAAVEVRVLHTTDSEPFELLRVSPNHHLSYVLELPAPGPWELRIVAERAGGGSLHADIALEELP